MDGDNLPLRPNDEGRSIMVSDFLCECHGPLKLSSEQQRKTPNIEPESVMIIKLGRMLMDIGQILISLSNLKKWCWYSKSSILIAMLCLRLTIRRIIVRSHEMRLMLKCFP